VSCRVVARVAGPAGSRSLHLHLSTPRTLARPRNGVRPVRRSVHLHRRRSAADGARPGEKAGGLLTSARVSSVRRWSRARRGLEPSGFARRRRCVARTGSFPLSRLSCRPRVNGHDSASCDDATCRANKTNGTTAPHRDRTRPANEHRFPSGLSTMHPAWRTPVTESTWLPESPGPSFEDATIFLFSALSYKAAAGETGDISNDSFQSDRTSTSTSLRSWIDNSLCFELSPLGQSALPDRDAKVRSHTERNSNKASKASKPHALACGRE
jgi:hypothetical protein